MLVLGIETSCDETAAALVEDGKTVLSSAIATQLDLLKKYGGVVPEIAARRHTELIGYVIKEALDNAGKTLDDVEAVAVTSKQGLVGCLMVGVAAAKSISYSRGLPLIGVHHIEGHIFANRLSNPALPFPHVCLTVSGGHNMLLYVRELCRYELLGATLDDAAGEAFDKGARLLGLGYPGGPAIQAAAKDGIPCIPLPRAWLKGSDDFSFSGLKTALLHLVQSSEISSSSSTADAAASFQQAIVEVLAIKTMKTAERLGIRQIVLAGGVAANKVLCDYFINNSPIPVMIPPPVLCTDNAAMIAACGYYHFKTGKIDGLDIDVVPSLVFG